MFSDQEIIFAKEILDEWGPYHSFKYWHGYDAESVAELEEFLVRLLMQYNIINSDK